jgi:hypothetical protein
MSIEESIDRLASAINNLASAVAISTSTSTATAAVLREPVLSTESPEPARRRGRPPKSVPEVETAPARSPSPAASSAGPATIEEQRTAAREALIALTSAQGRARSIELLKAFGAESLGGVAPERLMELQRAAQQITQGGETPAAEEEEDYL